jgi:NagD protein
VTACFGAKSQPIPAAGHFLRRACEKRRDALPRADEINSIYTRRDLAARLRRAGSTCPRTRSGPRRSPPRASSRTSVPRGSAFVIGEAGLTTALHEAGYTLTERAPDYVVLGETRPTASSGITRRSG